MPFINTKTSVKISKEQELTLKSKLGQAVSFLGKSEGWLMLNFEDSQRLWFKGSAEKDLAFVDIALFGKASDSQYDKMTAAVCEIVSDVLGIAGDCIYVKYEEVGHWGYSGFNF